MIGRRRLLLLALGFPPAARSEARRLREVARQFVGLGWEVTVLTADRTCHEGDAGLDPAMPAEVDPRIRLEELPLRRPELETDIRQMARERVTDPSRWSRRWDREVLEAFPERGFGAWRGQLEDAALRLQREEPFDLVVTSCPPYVLLAPAVTLHVEHGVPYAVDLRAAWSQAADGETGTPGADARRWEERALRGARSLWVGNDEAREHYAARYPDLADRIEVVPDGFDADRVPPRALSEHRADAPLRFGYVGTVDVPLDLLRSVLGAWRKARQVEPALAGATLTLRGRAGSGWRREATPAAELVRAARADGVGLGGPVRHDESREVYASWDALVLIGTGGPLVMPDEVYQYLASGLPILSVREGGGDASTLLSGYPLWADAVGRDEERFVQAWSAAARMGRSASQEERSAARAQGARYERQARMAPAVARLAEGIPTAARGAR